MREIEFRAKSKNTGQWVYGSLITKKYDRRVKNLDNTENCDYKYSIQYKNKKGNYVSCEVDEKTIGQFVGIGEYGKIYEGMELYDEYEEENCTIEYCEEDYAFNLNYDNYVEKVESLDGLQIVKED